MRQLLRPAISLICAMFFGLAFGQDSPDSVLRGTKQFHRRVLVSGLGGPWEVTWGPDDMLWVTERTGKRVTRINPATGERKVAITIPEVSAPGAQDGLLGMALHPDLLRDAGAGYVYVYYTYVDQSKGPHATFTDPRSLYRFLYGKVVRLTWNKASETLSSPQDVITGLPVGDDHVSGRLKIGPDRKLYLTIGDEGHNQFANFCLPIEAQRLPTRHEVSARNYIAYVGKSLRLNLDGSIPRDNPRLAGVISHVYTYGHRNMEGIDFAPDGTLYASEHGPKTDDEINILKAGSNYGWPHVAGLKDDKAYVYARWSESTVPCSQLTYNDYVTPPPSVPREPESRFTKPFVEPIATMFTVPAGYNFSDAACKGVDFVCWPTVGASSIEYYASKGKGIPGWDRVLLVTTLKRGSLYVQPLTADGQAAAAHMSRYFQSENRYRDTAVNPDGRTIYIATDEGGVVQAVAGGTTTKMENPGAILAFTYEGEGSDAPATVSGAGQPDTARPVRVESRAASPGAPPQFTAAQAAAGKAAYNANCAACHGSTMTNGTFAPPLAGDYFRNAWSGRTVRTFFEKAKTMPPAAPASLVDQTYADIVAYILDVNTFPAGSSTLPAGGATLDAMTIR